MLEERGEHRRRRPEYERMGMHGLIQRLGSDQRFGRALGLFTRTMDTLHPEGRRELDSVRAQRFAVRPLTDDPLLTRIFPLEETLDVFGLPYAAHSSSLCSDGRTWISKPACCG